MLHRLFPLKNLLLLRLIGLFIQILFPQPVLLSNLQQAVSICHRPESVPSLTNFADKVDWKSPQKSVNDTRQRFLAVGRQQEDWPEVQEHDSIQAQQEQQDYKKDIGVAGQWFVPTVFRHYPMAQNLPKVQAVDHARPVCHLPAEISQGGVSYHVFSVCLSS